MTCCVCTTSKCAGSNSCKPPGYLCLQGALVWVVLRKETHPGEVAMGEADAQGSWEPNGHTLHLSQQIFTQTLRVRLCAGSCGPTCEHNRLVAALSLLTHSLMGEAVK